MKMGKILVLPLLAALALVATTANSAEPIAADTGLYMSGGQVMVPILAICRWVEAEVEYDEANQTLTAKYGEFEFRFRAGEHHAAVNSEATPIDDRPGMAWSRIEFRDGQLFVPLRFLDARKADVHTAQPSLVAQALGFQIRWDTTCGGFATITRKGEDGRTATLAYLPLHWAAGQGHLEAAERLIDGSGDGGGIDVNASSGGGWTPLHWAAREGRVQTTRLLLERGADVNRRCKAGWVPLHWAARHGRTEVVQLLLERGAEVGAADGDGDLPLHWAARGGHTKVVELLLDNQADVNAINGVGTTALHNAAAFNHTDVANLLLDRGADVDPRTRTGITPLYWAERSYHEKTAALLRERGATN